MIYDLAVIGAGPGGSLCALLAARAGWRVALLDRAEFPRSKVCGDCLNPRGLAILRDLGLDEVLVGLDQSSPKQVRVGSPQREVFSLPTPEDRGELVIQRKLLDHALVRAAVQAGVEFFPGRPVRGIQSGWEIDTPSGTLRCRFLVGADGRNSTVLRQLGLARPMRRDRVAVQWHAPCSDQNRQAISMLLLRHGYGGVADCGGGEANYCFVASGSDPAPLVEELEGLFGPVVRSATKYSPISRPPARRVAGPGFMLIGDAARVVEPFTGEGIWLAMETGRLAARLLIEGNPVGAVRQYERQHPLLYRRMILPNTLSRWAGLHPQAALALARNLPGSRWLLASMTSKILRA